MAESQAKHGQQIRLIVDGAVGFAHRSLIISLAYRRRAIPIAWTWVEHVRGHSTGKTQLELLIYVRSLLPTGFAVLLVGDSEFGPVEVLRQLDDGVGTTFCDRKPRYMSVWRKKPIGMTLAAG